jgi:hypothetical protein
VATFAAAAGSASQSGTAKMAESIASCCAALETGKMFLIVEWQILFVCLRLFCG